MEGAPPPPARALLTRHTTQATDMASCAGTRRHPSACGVRRRMGRIKRSETLEGET